MRTNPTKSQVRVLKRIADHGPVMKTHHPDQMPSYSLVGGKKLNRDQIENYIAAGWLAKAPDGLFPDAGQTFTLADGVSLVPPPRKVPKRKRAN